jgi:sugar phosphate permease
MAAFSVAIDESARGEALSYRQSSERRGSLVIGILIAVLLAALVYFLCMALGLPAIVAIVAAILVLLAGVPSGGYGLGSRWGGRRGV